MYRRGGSACWKRSCSKPCGGAGAGAARGAARGRRGPPHPGAAPGSGHAAADGDAAADDAAADDDPADDGCPDDVRGSDVVRGADDVRLHVRHVRSCKLYCISVLIFFDFGNYSNDANVNTLIEPKNKGGIITLCMG